MVRQELVLKNNVGLHARPATFFIQRANEFKCSIWVEKDNRRVSAKSLLGVLSLGVATGDSILVSAEGEDEDAAVAGLQELVNSNFGEIA
ncbi:MAG: HPr family phosphocarrier protein [Clostridia bacterium]|nr:HPr family phosphocarrier protein [Clostridia bacterium]MBQ3077445.1 HPr family phosphocarrier protein [Clostridia bacterium]